MGPKEVKKNKEMTKVSFEALTQSKVATYIEVGTRSYNAHYLHLWKDRNPTSYLATSFTQQIVQDELKDPNCANYLVRYENQNAGILKISHHQGWGNWSAKEALYLHRIYLMKSFTGKGIGKAVLDFTQTIAESLGKKVIWLEAMNNGPALHFYVQHGYTIVGKSEVDLHGILATEKAMRVLAKSL
ncbi:MAG: GNAT family N-acetyltransferase [Allomuricauda sp.]|nr:MAG: GNAT family N-acetyltransferase [Allomuricauda sp.]